MEQLNTELGQFTPDNLIAGDKIPVLTKGITLAKGQGILKRGTVLGFVTASKLAKTVDKSKTDGTEKAYCILTDAVDTGDGTAVNDVKATAYFTGLFNSKALTFGGASKVADHEDQLKDAGIFLKDNMSY